MLNTRNVDEFQIRFPNWDCCDKWRRMAACERPFSRHKLTLGSFNEKFLIHRINESSNSIFSFQLTLLWANSGTEIVFFSLYPGAPPGAYYFKPFAIFLFSSGWYRKKSSEKLMKINKLCFHQGRQKKGISWMVNVNEE